MPVLFGVKIHGVAWLFMWLPFQGNLLTLKTLACTHRPGVRTSTMTTNPTLLNGVGAFSGYCPFYYQTRKHYTTLLLTNKKTFNFAVSVIQVFFRLNTRGNTQKLLSITTSLRNKTCVTVVLCVCCNKYTTA